MEKRFIRVGYLVEDYMEHYHCGFDEAIEIMKDDLRITAEDTGLKESIEN